MNPTKILPALLIMLGSIFTASGQTTTTPPPPPDPTQTSTQLTFYGFGRTNFTWDDQEMGRSDLFVPANIKVGDGPKNPNFFIGAKQTRLGVDLKHTVGGEDLILKFEGDFHNDASDATGIFRMRHAYAKYRFILVGMAWSNFFDIGANAVSVDFEGPMSSTLSRTPQIRFATYKTKNVLSLSFENPIEKITSTVDSITALPERFPDVIGAYRVNGKFGFVKVAALVRELRYQSDEARSLIGYGITVMGALKAGDRDKVRFQGVMGTGVAKYIEGSAGLNYDAISDGTNELEPLQMRGGSVSYQHFWKENMHSSITGGYLDVEENENLMANNYQSGYYGSINLFWNVIDKLTFGAETLVGQRVNVNDDSATGVRVQMSATYKFNKSIK